MIQSSREQRESPTGQGSHESVRDDNAIRVHEVHVDDITETLQEDQHHARFD